MSQTQRPAIEQDKKNTTFAGEKMTRLELNILGCGSATMTPRHQPSCQVLNVRDNLMMIDCGEGAQLAVRRMGLKLMRLNHIAGAGIDNGAAEPQQFAHDSHVHGWC